MIEAYVLAQTEIGRAAAVAEAVTTLPGVVVAHGVTGPYDVVVTVRVATMDDLGALISTDIAGVPGITRTLTCTVTAP